MDIRGALRGAQSRRLAKLRKIKKTKQKVEVVKLSRFGNVARVIKQSLAWANRRSVPKRTQIHERRDGCRRWCRME